MRYQITIIYVNDRFSRMTFHAASDQEAFAKARAGLPVPAIKSIVITDKRRS
jgi:hypothetical protein